MLIAENNTEQIDVVAACLKLAFEGKERWQTNYTNKKVIIILISYEEVQSTTRACN